MFTSYIPGFEEEVKPGAKVIIAISKENTVGTGGQLQTGPKLKAQLNYLRKRECDVTVLIADSLQRYNTSEEEARKWGAQFAEENKAELEGCKVVHWNDFIAARKTKFEEMQKRIEDESKSGFKVEETDTDSAFQLSMVRTFNNTAFAKSLKEGSDSYKSFLAKSLLYQKEEYAVILCMSDFDFLIYPKLTDGMAYLFAPTHFEDIQRTVFNEVSITPCTPKNATFFTRLHEKKVDDEALSNLSVSLLEDLAKTLGSTEAKEQDKKVLMLLTADSIIKDVKDTQIRTAMEIFLKTNAIGSGAADPSKLSFHSRELLRRIKNTVHHVKPNEKNCLLKHMGWLLLLRSGEARLSTLLASPKMSEKKQTPTTMPMDAKLVLAALASTMADVRVAAPSMGLIKSTAT